MKILIFLIILFSFSFLFGCNSPSVITPPAITVTIEKEVVKEVTTTIPVKVFVETEKIKIEYEYLWKEPRQFLNDTEIREYLANKPAYMPLEGQDCDDLARFFQLEALKDGYLVSQQYLVNYHGYEHMLIMAVAGNSIYYIEPSTNQFWWVSPLD